MRNRDSERQREKDLPESYNARLTEYLLRGSVNKYNNNSYNNNKGPTLLYTYCKM